MKVWVLTYEVNEYDQEGDYFLGVFADKPTKEQMIGAGVIFDRDQTYEHILSGGGRVNIENRWYLLVQYAVPSTPPEQQL